MKKINFFFLLFIFININLFSQNLSVYDIDTSNFPIMKAKFYAFGADGKQITNLSISDFEIKENGEFRKITNITCPAPTTPVDISSVLVFDVSGSMSYGAPNIELAKKAGNVWVDGLPAGLSECALVTFSDNSFIARDFTNNKQELKNSIAGFTPTYGTNYNQALLDAPCGGLQVAKNGKNKRVLIFLTDGMPNTEPNTNEIINLAKQNNIIIYGVTLAMPAPQCIKDMTSKTGGIYFENISTQKEVEDAYSKLLLLAQGGEPCEIEWQSASACYSSIKKIELKYPSLNLEAITNYQPPNSAILRLEFNPSSLKFLKAINDTCISVAITARNTDFNITKITPSNYAYRITSATNFTIKAGETKNVTVCYSPPDSGYTYCKFIVENDVCPTNFHASGGFPGKIPSVRTIKLIQPNGGEVYVAGSDTVITWEGVSPDEKVTIEYRTDDFSNWQKLTDTASGLSYNFHVPNVASDKYLARITARAFTGQECPEISICGQIWMGCNLDVDHYRNGDTIPQVQDSVEWANLTTGAWCYYNNSDSLGAIYGKLYNWYAVNDPRGLAPDGWHIPSNSEWNILINCLGGESIAGGMLKEAGTSHWESPNLGATNQTGFSALPGGCRINNGEYNGIGTWGFWWYIPQIISPYKWYNSMHYQYSSVNGYGSSSMLGLSVRCVRD